MPDSMQTLGDMAQARATPSVEQCAQGVVEIASPDLDRHLAFYLALGFRQERRTDSFAVVNGFGIRLFLAENAEAPTNLRWTNVRIIVPDVDAVRTLVVATGLPVTQEVASRPYGLRDFVVVDPAGFEVRFAQVL